MPVQSWHLFSLGCLLLSVTASCDRAASRFYSGSHTCHVRQRCWHGAGDPLPSCFILCLGGSKARPFHRGGKKISSSKSEAQSDQNTDCTPAAVSPFSGPVQENKKCLSYLLLPLGTDANFVSQPKENALIVPPTRDSSWAGPS